MAYWLICSPLPQLSDIKLLNEKETRAGFGEGILEAGRRNPNVVALTADLAGSLKLGPFMKEFPERYVQAGASKFVLRPAAPPEMLLEQLDAVAELQRAFA